ncbi:MAG: hypothetical protein AAGA21_01520 [Pseudomonadota bacterium]
MRGARRGTAHRKRHGTLPACRPARPKVGLGMPDLSRDAAADRDEAGWTREGAFIGQGNPKGRLEAGSGLVIGLERCAASLSTLPACSRIVAKVGPVMPDHRSFAPADRDLFLT